MFRRIVFAALALTSIQAAWCQTIQPPYSSSYSIVNLGPGPGRQPSYYGGLAMLNSNTLLVAEEVDASSSSILSAPVIRAVDGHITGFGNQAFFASAPYIDGGLAFGPGGVLFAATSTDNLLEYKPGSTSPDLTVALGPLGVANSPGALQFVPSGFGGSGGFKITTDIANPNEWYTAILTPNGSGTYDVSDVTPELSFQAGAEAPFYVPPGSPQFASASLLLNGGCSDGYEICAYAVSANGDPTGDPAIFASGFANPGSGPYGAVIDPIMGDLLVSVDNGASFMQNEIFEIQGFAPGTLTATAGNAQSAIVATPFANPLTVTLKDPYGNPVSGVTVSFAAPSSGAGATLSASSAVTAADGTASVTATANATAGSYAVTATVYSFSASFSLTNAALSLLTLSPASVTGGDSDANNTVTLTSAAPASGAAITLTSSNTALATVPSSVTVAGGQTVSAPFSIATTAVSSTEHVTIKASDGTNTKSSTLTVKPAALTAVKLSPKSATGGKSTTGNTVTLNGPAASSGAVVALSSSDSTLASVPASVTVASGSSTSPTFTITTTPVAADTPVTISANYDGVTKTASLTVNAPALSSLRLTPATVVGGHSTTRNTVTLNGAAPAGGVVVMLTSGDSTVASSPATVTVAAGSTSATFTITTTAVTSSTVVPITATFGGVTKTANLTVNP